MTKFTPELTQDGSYTFFSLEFDEAFHSYFGAKQEAEKKFVEPSLLIEKTSQQEKQSFSSLRLLDICYGLGYNSAAALENIWSVNPQCQIELIALEIDPEVPFQAIQQKLLNGWQQPIPQLLTQLALKKNIQTNYLQASLLIGDARKTIRQIHEDSKVSFYQKNWQADAIFLDPFSPLKCPQLWTVEFLQLVCNYLKSTGKIVTYSSSAAVRTALSLAGLNIGSTPGVGRKSPGTVASFSAKNLPTLSVREREHLQTRAAVPYRDPSLQDTANSIRQKRELEQQTSKLEPTSQWKKRWRYAPNIRISDASKE